MTITSQSAMSLLDSVLSAEGARVEVGVAVLKKAQDAGKQQGQAIIDLLEAAGATANSPNPTGQGLDVFA
jgi:hypothetical protein